VQILRFLVLQLFIFYFSFGAYIKALKTDNSYKIEFVNIYKIKKIPFFDDNYIVLEIKSKNIKIDKLEIDKTFIKDFQIIRSRNSIKIVFEKSRKVKQVKIEKHKNKTTVLFLKKTYNRKLKKIHITKHKKIKHSKIKIIKTRTDPLYNLIVKELAKERRLQILKPVVVVIDPGHGGKDPGAIANGLKEKNVNLKIAKKLKKMLESSRLYKVYLTRYSDRYVDLYTRTVYAVKKKADIFISIHCNASENIKNRGTYIYTLNLKGAKSKLARLVERRENIRAYHSATHLLHESLRRVLGTHVIQKGSLVEPDRLRFDFSHMKPISSEEINKIESFVNLMVEKKSDVKTRLMTPKEAVDNGALALFGEKYGDEVRVLSMGDEKEKYFSTELCGGTHVRNTGDIGKFKIVSQSSIAAGVRRVEALRDKELQDYLNNKEKLSDISIQKNEETIKELSERIIKLGGKPNLENKNQQVLIKDLNKQLELLYVKSILSDKTKNIINDQTINNTKVRFQKVTDLPPKDLRKLVDAGKKELGEGIVVVFASKDGKIGLAVGVTDKLTTKYDAVKFVKTGSKIVGGKGGGGRPDFAQAGGIEINKIDEAFEKLKALI